MQRYATESLRLDLFLWFREIIDLVYIDGYYWCKVLSIEGLEDGADQCLLSQLRQSVIEFSLVIGFTLN